MLKYLTLFGMLASVCNVDYVSVNSIEYYQGNEDVKKIIFDFDSDYFSYHEIEVIINFYDFDNKYIKGYSSKLNLIGDKKSIANINYVNNNDCYALIDVNYKGNVLVNDAKINFYIQDDCYIDADHRECKRIYKSYYKDMVSKDEVLTFNVNESNFYKYLSNNRLRVEDIGFYSNYSLKDSNIYLYICDSVDGYDLVYDNKYIFLLDMNDNNRLELVDSYFVNLFEFEFSENYKENMVKVKDIYFPYSDDYVEYNFSVLIEDFIDIKIDFSAFTKGNLLGDCNTSKYCVIHESN